MLVFFTNLGLMKFDVRYFGLFSPFLSNRWRQVFWVGSLHKNIYPVNAGVPQGFILGHTFFLQYIIDLCDDVICNLAIYAGDTSLYFKWDQLELASEFESDLRDTVDWGRK